MVVGCISCLMAMICSFLDIFERSLFLDEEVSRNTNSSKTYLYRVLRINR